ncbi:Leucine carboxyl methyltransferase [compost metagenome]
MPRELRWIEVDLPNLVAYKDACLANEPGACRIERIALDLSEAASRRNLLTSIGESSNGVLVLAEGLLLYLDPTMVTELAIDLAGVSGCQTWLMDLLHPAMLPFVVRSWNTQEAGSANVPRFAPEGGAEFFQPHGWTLHHWVSALEEAERLNRPISPAGVTLTDAQREASRTMNTYVRLDRARP